MYPPPPAVASDSQADAALGATSANDGTAAAGAHAHEEAVGTLATNDRRLISAFHGNIPRKEKRSITSFKRIFVKLYFSARLWITFGKPAKMPAADTRREAGNHASEVIII